MCSSHKVIKACIQPYWPWAFCRCDFTEVTWSCSWSVSTTRIVRWTPTGRRRWRWAWTPTRCPSSEGTTRPPTSPSTWSTSASPAGTPYRSLWRRAAVWVHQRVDRRKITLFDYDNFINSCIFSRNFCTKRDLCYSLFWHQLNRGPSLYVRIWHLHTSDSDVERWKGQSEIFVYYNW